MQKADFYSNGHADLADSADCCHTESTEITEITERYLTTNCTNNTDFYNDNENEKRVLRSA